MPGTLQPPNRSLRLRTHTRRSLSLRSDHRRWATFNLTCGSLNQVFPLVVTIDHVVGAEALSLLDVQRQDHRHIAVRRERGLVEVGEILTWLVVPHQDR